MPPITTMLLIRHGETLWNIAHRYQGHGDSELSEHGIAQTEALAALMQSRNFTHLYASDLGRTQQTAAAIARRTGHAIISEPRLRERNYGIFEGLTGTEIETRHPDIYHEYKTRRPDFIIPGGESVDQFVGRVTACFEELRQRHTAANIAVVTHGGVINRFLRSIAGIDQQIPRPFIIKNAAINIFIHDGQRWRLDTLGLEP
ncbi:MAG: histidine phosphatase family protein [Calditrichaeota bacterium]|nr:histidine phosphatase family protein [Calditrichota bacterium]